MEDVSDLREAINRFIIRRYKIEDLSRILSRIGVPNGLIEEVAETEYKLEKIRFLVSEKDQYKEAINVINPLIEKLNKNYSCKQ